MCMQIDIFFTNYRFKGHVCYLKNLKDLSVINVKFKGPIWNLKELLMHFA
jgi:hypothetical protein